jgi:hypothetical protein
MTQQLAIDQTEAATVTALPHPAALQEINVYSHSTLLYWWPGWAFVPHGTSQRWAREVLGYG